MNLQKFYSLMGMGVFSSFAIIQSSIAMVDTQLPNPPESLIIPDFKVRHGREITLTNKYLESTMYKAGIMTMQTKANKEGIEKMAKKMPCLAMHICNIEKEIRKGHNVYKVTYPGLNLGKDWYFWITPDPGVVELPLAPSTTEDAIYLMDVINRDIFDLGEHVFTFWEKDKLREPLRGGRIGATHDHVDWEVFKNNPILLRNFYVDLQNHPGLAMGGLESSINNAPPVIFLSTSRREKLMEILADFDSDLRKGQVWSAIKLAEKIQTKVQTETFMKGHLFNGFAWRPPSKYQMANFSRLFQNFISAEKKTVELRFFRAAKNVQELILQQALMDHRMYKYYKMNKNKHYKDVVLVPFLNKHIDKIITEGTTRGYFNKTANPVEVVGQFYSFVVGANLDWKYYRQLLPAEFQKYAHDTQALSQYNPYRQLSYLK